MKGLEPPRLSAPDPKSGSATNYDTSAKRTAKILLILEKFKEITEMLFPRITSGIHMEPVMVFYRFAPFFRPSIISFHCKCEPIDKKPCCM
jgi:hypothetical protein